MRSRNRHSRSLAVSDDRFSEKEQRARTPGRRPERQRGPRRAACSQSLAEHERWPVGGWRLLMGECNSAPNLLDHGFQVSTITSCLDYLPRRN